MKRVHDSVLNKSVTNSVVAQWLKLSDFLHLEQWENTPGNYDGIYRNIVLPELRQQKDIRVLEYWDGKLKREAEAATKTKLSFEVDKFNTQRRPSLIWSRTQEYIALGQKNRAITDMYNLIRSFPMHPEADEWIGKLEAMLLPPDPTVTPAAPAAPGAPPTTGGPTQPNPTAAVPGAPRTSGL